MNQLPNPFELQSAELSDINNARPNRKGIVDLPVLPLRDLVLFPRMIAPLNVSRDISQAAINQARSAHSTVIALAQIDPEDNAPQPNDFHIVGTEAAPARPMRLPDGNTSVLVQGRRRLEIVEVYEAEGHLRAKARVMHEPEIDAHDPETEALMRVIISLLEKAISLKRDLPEEALVYALNIDEPGWLADWVTTTLELELLEYQSILETISPLTRLQRVSILLGREINRMEMEERIHADVQQRVDASQKEFYLREQLKAIQTELGEIDVFQQELEELREKIENAHMPDEALQRARIEYKRLLQQPPMSPETGVIRTYLEWLIDLPWEARTEDNLDLKHAREVLDTRHFGLEKAKERILEYIAVRKLAQDPDKIKQPILCFVGPPGTGKTSLGASIAEALGRKFGRLSLGGVRDEAEIRGHRRTYIGALPGRVLHTMRRVSTVNPLIMLDEIDKMSSDFRGDPASALLEVLDPEQNHNFSDHYLELPYDLSQVLFVTTANTLWSLPPALEDRLEVIEFSSYTEDEKVEISRKFLIPRQYEQNSLQGHPLEIDEDALRLLVREYTYESGVRELERQIATICRKLARQIAEEKPAELHVTADHLLGLLGPSLFPQDEANKTDEVGLVTGLAWTANGGEITPIEVAMMDGKGEVQVTGQVGEVMQESIQAAYAYLRSRAKEYGFKLKGMEKKDIAIHMPEAATSKDGPSAGVTIATALLSVLTGRKVRSSVAMTGEITLRGRVLPIGGLKEKMLAAHRMGIKTVIIPKKNAKDLIDIPERVKADIQIEQVEHIDQVLAIALLPAEARSTRTRTAQAQDAPAKAATPRTRKSAVKPASTATPTSN